MTSHKRRGSAFVEGSLLLTVFFFGTNFTAVKYVVESVPPILFAAARFTLAGLLPVALLSGPAGRPAGRDLLPMLGLVGVAATQSVFTVGVSLTTAANTALAYSTAPEWGMLRLRRLGMGRLPRRGEPHPHLPVPRYPHRREHQYPAARRGRRSRPARRRRRYPTRCVPCPEPVICTVRRSVGQYETLWEARRRRWRCTTGIEWLD